MFLTRSYVIRIVLTLILSLNFFDLVPLMFVSNISYFLQWIVLPLSIVYALIMGAGTGKITEEFTDYGSKEMKEVEPRLGLAVLLDISLVLACAGTGQLWYASVLMTLFFITWFSVALIIGKSLNEKE